MAGRLSTRRRPGADPGRVTARPSAEHTAEHEGGIAMTGTGKRESAVDRIRERVEEKAARRAAATPGPADR